MEKFGGAMPPPQFKRKVGGGKTYHLPPPPLPNVWFFFPHSTKLKFVRPLAEICPKIFFSLRPESNNNITIISYFNLNYQFTLNFVISILGVLLLAHGRRNGGGGYL